MRTRPGFARLLPLMALTGLAAGTIALLASARPVQAPPRHDRARHAVACRPASDGGCSDVPAPVPAHGIVDADGRALGTGGHPRPRRSRARPAKRRMGWRRSARRDFLDCDFRGCDLRGANLIGTAFKRCHLARARLAPANAEETKFTACRFRDTGIATGGWPRDLGKVALKRRGRWSWEATA